LSAEILFQTAESSLAAFMLAKIAGVEKGTDELAKTAARRQLEVATAKNAAASHHHLVNAAVCFLSVGDKSSATHALQRAHAVAPEHLKGHCKGALAALAAASAAPPPKPAQAPPPPAPKPTTAKVETPKPAEAPKEAPKAAETKPVEAPKATETKP